MRTLSFFALRASRLLLMSAALGLMWTSAAAQVVYKLTDRDGHVLYSDRVVPGTRVVGKITPPPPPDPELVAAARAAQTERAQHAQTYSEQRTRALDAADARIRAAEQRLDAARRALEAGAEPLAGERSGVARKGFSRLAETYWERLSGLEDEVAQATRALEQAYSERNALRD